jgi:predicted nucleic acid-binding Zn ribbon protein
MSPHRRSPRPLGFALERMQAGLAPDTLLAEVQQAWDEAVGAGIAAAAQPTSERAGVVTVSCVASVWSHELDLMAPVLIERLNERLARGRVSRLRCVTLPPREG